MFKLSAGLPARTAAVLASAALAVMLAACGTDPKKDDAKSVAKLYEEAREEASAGSYEAAIKLYERLEGQAAGTLLAQQAQLEQAYLLFKMQEKARALSVVERFLKLHPTSPAADYALYLQGLINFNDDLGLFGNLIKQDLSERDQQASRDAYASFKLLVERFPESKYAPDAVLRMKYIIATLAAYEVHVARYYLQRGAYVAAANRGKFVLENYRQSPALEEALAIMAKSYEKLGLNDLRDDAMRVLKLNFPKSPYVSGDLKDREKAWWKFW